MNAAGRAPLAFVSHLRLILPAYVHALLVCLSPNYILILMGTNYGEKQAINNPANEPGLPLRN